MHEEQSIDWMQSHGWVIQRGNEQSSIAVFMGFLSRLTTSWHFQMRLAVANGYRPPWHLSDTLLPMVMDFLCSPISFKEEEAKIKEVARITCQYVRGWNENYRCLRSAFASCPILAVYLKSYPVECQVLLGYSERKIEMLLHNLDLPVLFVSVGNTEI